MSNIMNEYTTFHKVLDYLQYFQEQSPMLNTFGYGNLVDFGKNVSGSSVNYPFLFVVPQAIEYQENMTVYSVTMIFADILNWDLSNEKDCVSDMSWEAKRFLSYLKYGQNTLPTLYDNIDVNMPVQAIPFFERFGDHVAGVAMEVPLIVYDTLDACDYYPTPTPTSEVTPTPTPSGGPEPTPTPTPSPEPLTYFLYRIDDCITSQTLGYLNLPVNYFGEGLVGTDGNICGFAYLTDAADPQYPYSSQYMLDNYDCSFCSQPSVTPTSTATPVSTGTPTPTPTLTATPNAVCQYGLTVDGVNYSRIETYTGGSFNSVYLQFTGGSTNTWIYDTTLSGNSYAAFVNEVSISGVSVYNTMVYYNNTLDSAEDGWIVIETTGDTAFNFGSTSSQGGNYVQQASIISGSVAYPATGYAIGELVPVPSPYFAFYNPCIPAPISVYSQVLSFTGTPNYNSIQYKCDGTTVEACYSIENQNNMTDLVNLFNTPAPDPLPPSCDNASFCYCWTDYGTYYDNGDGRIRCEMPSSLYNTLCSGGTLTLNVIND